MQIKLKRPLIIYIILNVIFSLFINTVYAASGQSTGQGSDALTTLISVDFNDMIFEETIAAISKKSNMIINYNRDRIPKEKRITLKRDNIPVFQVLNEILASSGMELNVTSLGQVAIVPMKKEQRQGILKGQVIDKDTKKPLTGVNVMLKNTTSGAATDDNGEFIIDNIPVGNYVLEFTCMGYRPVTKTDIIVKSHRIINVNIELQETVIKMEGVTIKGGYFADTREQPTSAVNFTGEEIRRSPGATGDVCRILSGLASVSKVNEQDNSLVVRGGSPMENGFFIDNIEVPNINHYPTQGSSGGPIGLVNVEFIRDINFSAGGFSAAYGDKLSSITNIRFREGNRDEFDTQFDLSMIGVGLTAEGPFANRKGSFLFSVRRSYVDIFADLVGMHAVPRYSDYQGKAVYEISPRHKLTFLTLIGHDLFEFDRDEAGEQGSPLYEDYKATSATFGSNWRFLWNKKGYSNTALSVSSVLRKTDTMEYKTGDMLFKNRSDEHAIKFRSINYYRVLPSVKLEFGIDAKYITNRYNNMFGEYTDVFGGIMPALSVDKHIADTKTGLFMNVIYHPVQRLKTTWGLRYDHSSYNQNSNISPRFSFAYRLNALTTINGAVGIYHQNLSYILFSQHDDYKKLANPTSKHFVLGVEYLLTENTRLTCEVYYKNYDKLPIDPAEPSLLVVDELYNRYGYSFFFNHAQLFDGGKAFSRGLEVVVQKKLAEKIYGTVSVAWFKSRYKGYDNTWRDRTYDNEYIFGIDGGYKPNKSWEYSIRWNFAGGIPYTPIDQQVSHAINRAVYDNSRVNQVRYPTYHSLNVRVDRRFHFRQTNLITYFVLYNAYNRKNMVAYFWNEVDNKQSEMTLWGTLPVLGVEYEF